MSKRSLPARTAVAAATTTRRAVLMASIALFLPVAGCNLDIATPVDRAVNEIDQAIAQIERDSTRWQAVLQQLAEQFPKDIQGTVRNEVTQLAQRSVAAVGIEFRCNADFLADRAIQGLRRVRAMLLKQTPEPVRPSVCHMIPSVVDLNEAADSRAKIEIAGYDMDRRDAAGKPLRVVLFSDQTGESMEMPEERIGRATHYVVNLNVRGDDFDQLLRQRKVSKIRLLWGDALQGQNEVLVIPRGPQQKTITPVGLGKVTFVPRRTDGDADFDTDDDEHMTFRVSAETRLQGDDIQVRAFMHAREPRPDHTTVEGWSRWETAWTAPAGWRIVSVTPLGSSTRAGRITDHSIRKELLPEGEIVNRFEIYGDRDGDEAGSYTRVEAHFNAVTVRLEEVNP
jgi:hypothetical protein